jgi:hypothetical protein
MPETSADQVGRATAMVTLALNKQPNIDTPLLPLARLGHRGMVSELFATLRAMALLAARLAGDAAARSPSGESSQAILQRVSALVQAELLDHPGE